MSFGLYIGDAIRGYNDAEDRRFKRRSQRRREFLSALEMMPQSSSASDLVKLHKDTFGDGWLADNSGFDNEMLEGMAKERNRRFELQKLSDQANRAQSISTLRENTLQRARDAAADGPETLRNFLTETVPQMEEAGVDTGLADWDQNFEEVHDRLSSQWITQNLKNYVGRPLDEVKAERPDIFNNKSLVQRLQKKNTTAFNEWMDQKVEESPHLFYDPDTGSADTAMLRQRAQSMGADWSQVSKDTMERLEQRAKQIYDSRRLGNMETQAKIDAYQDKAEEDTTAGRLKRYKTERNKIVQDYAEQYGEPRVRASEDGYKQLGKSEMAQRGDAKMAFDALATEGVYMSAETRGRAMEMFRLYNEGDLTTADPRTGKEVEVEEPEELVGLIKRDIANREGRVLYHDNAASAMAQERYQRELKALELADRFGDNNEKVSNYKRLRSPSKGKPLDDQKEDVAELVATLKASQGDLSRIGTGKNAETGEPTTMADPNARQDALFDLRKQRSMLASKIREHEGNVEAGGPGTLDADTLDLARTTVSNIDQAIALIEKNTTNKPKSTSATSGAVTDEPAPGEGPKPTVALKEPTNTNTPEYRSAVDEGVAAVKRAYKTSGDITAAAAAVARKYVPADQVQTFMRQINRRLAANGSPAAGLIKYDDNQQRGRGRGQTGLNVGDWVAGVFGQSSNLTRRERRERDRQQTVLDRYAQDDANWPGERRVQDYPQDDANWKGERGAPFSDAFLGNSDMPRGIRNNNPGNIEQGDDWQGLASKQIDDRFATFSDPAYGIRAIHRTLQTYQNKHGINTVRGILSRWAPNHENDTSAYISHVAGKLGVQPDEPIDVKDPEVANALVQAIIQHENGMMPYDDATLRRAQRLASTS